MLCKSISLEIGEIKYMILSSLMYIIKRVAAIMHVVEVVLHGVEIVCREW